MIKKGIIILILFLILLLLLVGCWNYREIDDLNIVLGAAVDRDEKTKEIIITAEIIDQGQAGQTVKPVVIESRGRTIFEAIRNFIPYTGKRLYWGQNLLVIISEEIAKEDIVPIIDLFFRDAEMRMDIYVLISTEKTAKEILNVPTQLESNFVSMNLWKILEKDRRISQIYPSSLWMFIKSLREDYVMPILPTVSIRKGQIEGIELSGTAVFKGGKVVGYLDERETINLLFILGEAREGFVVNTGYEDKKTKIAAEIKGNVTKIKPVVEGDNLVMYLNIKTRINLSEQGCNDNLFTKEGLKVIKKDIEEEIKKGVESLIEKVQKEYGSDIFRFSKIIEAKKPEIWRGIKDNWNEVFRDLETRVNVEVTIIGTSLSDKPVLIKD